MLISYLVVVVSCHFVTRISVFLYQRFKRMKDNQNYIEPGPYNGKAHFENVKKCLNTVICSYLDTSGGQSSDLYINVHFLNTSVS
jgi:hypothetical protein